MTFVERMKELLDQGAVITKEFAIKASEKAKDLSVKAQPMVAKAGEKARDLGVKAQPIVAKAGEKARDLGVKAGEKAKDLGAKAQDLGERGVLMFEIRQLESQAQKLVGRLGTETYQTFVERGETTVSDESAPIKSILSEIAAARKSIEEKQAELKARKGK